uniref:Alpha-conotoxin GI n=1 Tax=Conus geographus TaxID=6491 RepID=CA1_CONGE|nr:RecName: Full=Alpha-conotoxin GI; AltName: Full=G1; Flags: Precursor [Conus geographus]BAO65577.1 G044_VD_Superfamily_A_precursor_conopeptide [Conus geographus]
MGMRMMFTVFLLVVLATTVVSFPSERASDGRDDTAKDEGSDMDKLVEKKECCNPACGRHYSCGR